MAPKRALQNILGTQKVGDAIFEISPASYILVKVGASPQTHCSAALEPKQIALQ